MRPREHRLRRAASAAPQGRMKYRATATHALPARSAVAALSVLRGPPNRTIACKVVYGIRSHQRAARACVFEAIFEASCERGDTSNTVRLRSFYFRRNYT